MRSQGRRRRGYVAAVGVSALSVVAAAALGASPATASTAPSPVKHRATKSLPKGLTSSGSFRLGTQRSAAEKVDRSLKGAEGEVDVMLELDAVPASAAFGRARSGGATAAR